MPRYDKKEIKEKVAILLQCSAIGESFDKLKNQFDHAIQENKYQEILTLVEEIYDDKSLYCIESDRVSFYQTIDLLIRGLRPAIQD